MTVNWHFLPKEQMHVARPGGVCSRKVKDAHTEKPKEDKGNIPSSERKPGHRLGPFHGQPCTSMGSASEDSTNCGSNSSENTIVSVLNMCTFSFRYSLNNTITTIYIVFRSCSVVKVV